MNKRAVMCLGWAACMGVSGFVGCAHESVKPQGVTAERGVVRELVIQVEKRLSGASEWVSVDAEEIVNSGDRYRLAVSVGASAFVYAARVSSERPIEWLVSPPGKQPQRLGAGESLVLPRSEDGVVLDDRIGEENIYVIAAQQELAEDVLKSHIAAAPAAEPGPPRERPPTLGDKNRGKAPTYVGKPIVPGVLGLRFLLQHQK